LDDEEIEETRCRGEEVDLKGDLILLAREMTVGCSSFDKGSSALKRPVVEHHFLTALKHLLRVFPTTKTFGQQNVR
jgi:hypothetical protein